MVPKLHIVCMITCLLAGCIIGIAADRVATTPQPAINVSYVDYVELHTNDQLQTTIEVLDIYIAREQNNIDDVVRTRNTFAYVLANRT